MKKVILFICHALCYSIAQAQSYEAHLELAKQAYFEGDLEIAIREINNAINYNRKQSWTYYVRSTINAELGNYNEAYIDVDSAIGLEKDVYYYYAQRGECLFVFDKYEEALKDLNIALAGDSTLDEAYFNRYAILDRLGELTQSFRDINKAIDLKPHNIRYLYGKANLLEQLGELDSALVYYSRAFHAGKHYSYFFSYLASCDMMELNQLDTALSWHNWTLDNFGRFIGNLSGRGQTYMEMGRYNDAIQDFTELIENDKRRLYGRVTTSFYFRGVCYDSLGDRQKAMSDFNESITWDTTNAKSYAGRASLYIRSGQTDRAIRDLNKALYHEPKLGFAYYLRGLIYLNDYKDPESACEDFMAARRFKYKPAIAMLRKHCVK